MWKDILKAELTTSLEEWPEIREPGGMFPTSNLGEYNPDTDRALVFLDNVWSRVTRDGVDADDIDKFIELLIDVDMHEVSHQAMAKELEPRYKKFERRLLKLVKNVDVENFKETQKDLKRLVGDYTEMLFMEEVYAYSTEKNVDYSELKDNYDMLERIEHMVNGLLQGNLKPIQRNLANIIAHEAERKWDFLGKTVRRRILKIKGD